MSQIILKQNLDFLTKGLDFTASFSYDVNTVSIQSRGKYSSLYAVNGVDDETGLYSLVPKREGDEFLGYIYSNTGDRARRVQGAVQLRARLQRAAPRRRHGHVLPAQLQQPGRRQLDPRTALSQAGSGIPRHLFLRRPLLHRVQHGLQRFGELQVGRALRRIPRRCHRLPDFERALLEGEVDQPPEDPRIDRSGRFRRTGRRSFLPT